MTCWVLCGLLVLASATPTPTPTPVATPSPTPVVTGPAVLGFTFNLLAAGEQLGNPVNVSLNQTVTSVILEVTPDPPSVDWQFFREFSTLGTNNPSRTTRISIEASLVSEGTAVATGFSGPQNITVTYDCKADSTYADNFYFAASNGSRLAWNSVSWLKQCSQDCLPRCEKLSGSWNRNISTVYGTCDHDYGQCICRPDFFGVGCDRKFVISNVTDMCPGDQFHVNWYWDPTQFHYLDNFLIVPVEFRSDFSSNFIYLFYFVGNRPVLNAVGAPANAVNGTAEWPFAYTGSKSAPIGFFLKPRDYDIWWCPHDSFNCENIQTFTIKDYLDCPPYRFDNSNSTACDCIHGTCSTDITSSSSSSTTTVPAPPECICDPGYWGPDCSRGCSGELTLMPTVGTDGSVTGVLISDNYWNIQHPDELPLPLSAAPQQHNVRNAKCIYKLDLSGLRGPNNRSFEAIEVTFDWMVVASGDSLKFVLPSGSTTTVGQRTYDDGTFNRTFTIDGPTVEIQHVTFIYEGYAGWQLRYKGVEEPSDTQTVTRTEVVSLGAGAKAGIALAVIAVVATAVIVFIVWFCKKRNPPEVELTEPDWQKVFNRIYLPSLRDANALWSALPSKSRTKRTELFEDLCRRFPLLGLVLSEFSIDRSLANFHGLLLEYYQQLGPGLLVLGQHDIETDMGGANQAFRMDSSFTRTYAVAVILHGLPWGYRVLAEPLQEFYRGTQHGAERSLFDQMQHGTITAAEAYGDILKLKEVASHIFTNFVAEAESIPRFLLLLIQKLSATMDKKMGSAHSYQTLSSLVFLRFLCPLVASPHEYGLLPPDWTLSPRQHRSLILLTKVLQNMASMQEFVAEQGFVEELNDFIRATKSALKDTYASLLEIKIKDNIITKQSTVVEVNDRLKTACVRKLYAQVGRERQAFTQAVRSVFGRMGQDFGPGALSFGETTMAVSSFGDISSLPTSKTSKYSDTGTGSSETSGSGRSSSSTITSSASSSTKTSSAVPLEDRSSDLASESS